MPKTVWKHLDCKEIPGNFVKYCDRAKKYCEKNLNNSKKRFMIGKTFRVGRLEEEKNMATRKTAKAATAAAEKTTPVKTEEVKKETAATAAPAKKAPAKRAAAKKTAAAKPAAVKETVYIQFAGAEYNLDDIKANAKKAWAEETGKKESDVKEIQIYVKPEEHAAYYVINGEFVEGGRKVEL